ncbi:hypothetical protein M514_06576, partial [Trichuris suis]|uniref:RING-type E3 ubiquitin transferase n=1 Tax=Trichuris suis TaxID=68888 RepID=A0A085M5P6_9BILA
MTDDHQKELGYPDSFDQSNECQACPVCFEQYTTAGEQRPACLPCGHLFCLRCLEVWNSERPGRVSLCPTCKRRFRRREIRTHFVQGIKATDNSELMNAMKTIQEYKERMKRTEIELANAKYEATQQRAQYEQLCSRLEEMERKLQEGPAGCFLSCSQRPKSQSNERPRAEIKETIYPHGHTELRVMTIHPEKAIMLSSCHFQKFFSCYSAAKVDLHTMQYVSSSVLHTMRIRDMQFCPTGDSTFLTCSMDMSMKVHNSDNFQHVTTIRLGNPIWSCCYDSDEPHRVFAGTSTGQVKLYDLRMVRSSDDCDIPVLNVCNMRKPILSLRWSKFQSDTRIPSGLMIASTSECSFYSKSVGSNEFNGQTLPLDGRITSFFLDNSTGHFLVSMGPNSRLPTCQHLFCNLQRRDSENWSPEDLYELCIIRRFGSSTKQTVLNRNCLFRYADHVAGSLSSVAAVYDEYSHQMELWNMDTNERTYCTAMPGNSDDPNYIIYDLTTYNRPDGRQLLLALSKRCMYTYDLL